MLAAGIRPTYSSGECEIDLARRELRVLGSPVPVGGRAFEVIEVLVESAGELVTKDELMSRIWPGAVVMESTLHVHAAAVRKALGPYRSLLKTESRRGYRLLGDWIVRHYDAAKPPVGLQRMESEGESPVTNLPATVTRLIGRSAVVARLRDLISAYRVVTLTGPGGIGKTSLALKVARRVIGEYADGGWLVELASLSDPALVASAVAGALRLRVASNNIVPEAVAHVIGAKKLLLVLDNCEHLIGAVATLAETLVALCPHTTILATSREVIRIHGEFVYRVPPLEVPAMETMDPTQIMGHSAAEFFITRAGELGVDFSFNTRYPPMVAMICRHLDGIPLALEFAAARAATLGIEQVAIGLRDRFDILTNGRRTALPRHQTLRATLDWSYQLLSGVEQQLLNRLAIFAGTFSFDAACAVAGMTASEIADGIVDLIGKSLILNAVDRVTTEFRLLETTRIYARDRLHESDAVAEVSRRHARYLLGLLATFDEERHSQPTEEYLAAFRRRADEIHVALEWAFSSTGAPEIGLALTIAAVPLWFELFHLMVARARLEQALDRAEAGSDQEMRLRVAMGHALWYTDPEDVGIEPAFTRALEIAERTGGTMVRTQVIWPLWSACHNRGDHLAALAMARQHAAAAESGGDLGGIQLADRMLAITHHCLGDQPIAREFAERGLRHAHDLGSSLGFSYQPETPRLLMMAQLARILWLQGFPDQASVAAAEALAAAQQRGHLFAMITTLALAGVPVALWTGAADEAWRRVDLLIASIARTVGNQRTEQWGHCFAALMRLHGGNESEKLAAAFLEPRVDFNSVPPLAHLTPEANIAVPLPSEEPVQVLWNTPELLRVDAELVLWHAAPDAAAVAEAKLLRALEIAREQTALSWELRAAISLARLWPRHGRAAQARDLLIATYGKFTEGFSTSDLVCARSLLADFESDPTPA